MGVKVTNNGFGTLSAGINSSATTVTVDSGQGARFPTLGQYDYFFATLVDTSNNLEIIKVTARSTDSMTVTRAQDNTSARAFSIGDRIELRPTAALFEAIKDEAEVVADTTPQLGGNLDLNSHNINDGTFLADSSRIRFPNASSNPSSPNTGDAYYNTTNKIIKHWDGANWIQMSNVFSANGGTESTATIGGVNYKIHTFTSSGTLSITSGSQAVEYLIVAGGGGGGGAGGGGAGGLLQNVGGTGRTIAAGSYAITVGAGGGGASQGSGLRGSNGANSVFDGLTAIGGGGGGAYVPSPNGTEDGSAGGSGGGGGYSGSGVQDGGAGTSGQGNAGGNTTHTSPNPYSASGGGGAGAVGQGSQGEGTSGAGGAGLQVNIDGNNHYWAGGGGGGAQGSSAVAANGGIGGGGGGACWSSGTAGTGGGSALNSGGNGQSSSTSPNIGGAGGANTGGGGGGMGISVTLGGAGGSGIVIIRYAV